MQQVVLTEKTEVACENRSKRPSHIIFFSKDWLINWVCICIKLLFYE